MNLGQMANNNTNEHPDKNKTQDLDAQAGKVRQGKVGKNYLPSSMRGKHKASRSLSQILAIQISPLVDTQYHSIATVLCFALTP